MAQKKQARGRPKGSGIDDTPNLEKIRELIAANPDLKPTTAIRQIGITNDSVIRRLRDKYRKACAATPRSNGRQHPDCAQNKPRQTSAQAAPSAMALSAASDPVVATKPSIARGDWLDRTLTKSDTTTREPQMVDPTFAVKMLAASVAAANFFAVQQTIIWHASCRELARSTHSR